MGISREESCVKNFCFYGENPEFYVRSQWTTDLTCYLVYRICVAVGMLAFLGLDYWAETETSYNGNPWFWFIYATDWGFICLVLTSLVQAYVAAVYWYGHQQQSSAVQLGGDDDCRMTHSMSVLWLMYNISSPLALVISAFFWSVYRQSQIYTPFMITDSSRLKHLINSIYVLSDIMVSAIPIRLHHVIYPLMAGCIYIAFNYSYYTMGGTGPGHKPTPYIYYEVNWNYPIQAGICCVLVLGCVVLAQLTFFGLYKLRLCIFERVLSKHNAFGCADQESMFLKHSRSRDGSYQSTIPSGTEELDIQETFAY